MGYKAIVFDAYGTLFDVAAAARALAEAPGADPAFAAAWPAMAETWRLKQLEYSWIRALAGAYADFWRLTEDALDYALEKHGLAETAPRDALLALYQKLPAYPDAREALAALKDEGRQIGILSNGAPSMLAAAIDAAGLDGVIDAALSADQLQTFKVRPEVYALATDRFDCAPADVFFVSSNGWDVCSAAAYGFTSVWVNRRGDPVDRLHGAPAAQLPNLSGLPDAIRGFET